MRDAGRYLAQHREFVCLHQLILQLVKIRLGACALVDLLQQTNICFLQLARAHELHPQIPGASARVGGTVLKEQPQQAGVMSAGRRDARLVAVEHERQQHRQRRRLAGAVGAAQQ